MSHAEALRAVAALHMRGIVHNSLGTGSLMVNTLDEARAKDLLVKVENFGFAQQFSGNLGPGSAFDRGQRADQEALAVTFCELAFGSLVMDGGRTVPRTDAVAFQRLLLEAFARDTTKLQEYCSTIDEWATVMEFWDAADGSGWGLLDALLQGASPCADLVDSPFLVAVSA
jgi:hypothetical protein